MITKDVLSVSTTVLALLATSSLAQAQTVDTRIGRLELQAQNWVKAIPGKAGSPAISKS